MTGGEPAHQGRWLWRTVRGLRPDRNPLRRGTDRLEACLLAGLCAAAAAAAPFAAQAGSRAAALAAQQVRQQQLATRHQVAALLTVQAPVTRGYALTVPAQATWWSVDGTRRSGPVPARPGTLPGASVLVWTDARGYLVSPPLGISAVSGDADAAGAAAVLAVVTGAAAAAAAVRRLADRWRMAAWEADWLVTARAWNRQR
jgi:hypothetical protein